MTFFPTTLCDVIDFVVAVCHYIIKFSLRIADVDAEVSRQNLVAD